MEFIGNNMGNKATTTTVAKEVSGGFIDAQMLLLLLVLLVLIMILMIEATE